MKFDKKKNGLCVLCEKHPAKFKRQGGQVKRDKDHNICLQCFRAVRSANWAMRVREHEAETPLSLPQ